MTLVVPAVLSVQIPSLTGGVGTLASPAVTLVSAPVLAVQLPTLTGGTGSLASPEVTLVSAAALLELTDRVLPDGRVVVRSSLIEAGSASLYNDQGDGTIIDGDFVPELIGADVIISRVLVTTNGQLRLNRVGSTNIETLFTTGAYADALTHVQVERDSALSFAASDIDAATSSAVRLRYNLTAAELATIQGITDGVRWILTFTQPEPAAVLSVELPGITGGTGALASPAVTTVAAAVSTIVVELPALTGGVGSLAAPAVTLVTPPVLPVELPPLTGGTGSLAAPAITLVTPAVLSVQIPALTGATGSLAPLAVTLNTAAVLAVEIPTLTGGVGSLAAPAVTLVLPLLTLPDIAIPTGRRLVGTTEGSLLASVADVVADIFGVMYIAGDTVLAGDDPVALGDTGLSVVRILQTSNNQLRINENGAGDFLALYSAGGTYAARQFHVQVDTATVVTVTAADIDAGTSTADRLRWNLTATQQTELQSLDLGSRFIHFITEPDTPPVLAVEIPAITGGTGSLAAPEVTLFEVQPEIIAILVQLPTITGGSGSLAAIAVTVVTPSITTISVRIPAITGGTGTIASPAVTVVTGTTPVTPVTPGADGSVEILEADRSAVVVLPDGGTSLSRIVKSFEVTELLTAYGRQESVSHLFLSGFSPVVTADPPVLTRRRIVRVSRTGQVPEEWRISQSVRHVDGLADAQLQLEPLWMDLSGRISKRVTGQVQRVDWTLVGRTPAEALAAILDDAPGFVAGTVDAAFRRRQRGAARARQHAPRPPAPAVRRGDGSGGRPVRVGRGTVRGRTTPSTWCGPSAGLSCTRSRDRWAEATAGH